MSFSVHQYHDALQRAQTRNPQRFEQFAKRLQRELNPMFADWTKTGKLPLPKLKVIWGFPMTLTIRYRVGFKCARALTGKEDGPLLNWHTMAIALERSLTGKEATWLGISKALAEVEREVKKNTWVSPFNTPAKEKGA